MEADNDFTLEQIEKIAQFQEVTGVEQIDVAKAEMIRYNWNMETAVQNFLHMRDSPPDSPRQVSIVNSEARPDSVAVQHTSNVGVLRWSMNCVYYIFTWPVKTAYSSLSSLLFFILRFITVQQPRVTNPTSEVTKFIIDYSIKYGTIHPTFFEGSYSQALNFAKSELKFMLAYLHGEDHQDTDKFCRNTLNNASLIEYIENSMVFWGCSVTSGEGYRVSQALRENSYPFLAVIVLRENKMTVVGRIEGYCNSDRLLTRLRDIVRDNEGYLYNARADRQEREQTATLRQQQDIAYEESLCADREKARRKRLEEQKVEEAIEAKRMEAQKEQEAKDNIRKLKIELADRIPPEPEVDSKEVLHIVAKLPKGARLERKFIETDSLKSLYYYIFCHPASPDRFQVTTNFPRQVVPCEPTEEVPEPPTFKEFGLARRSMVFVSDLDA